MRSLLLSCLITLLIFVSLVISEEAFAHEVPSEFKSEFLTTENEQISDNTLNTGEHVTIVGIVANHSHERVNVSMTIFTESNDGIANWQLLAKDPPYRTFEIPPGFNDQSYSITLRALNPGNFHLHVQFNNIDTGKSILSVGQPVHVTGPAISANELKVSEINVKIDQSNFTRLRINSTSEITNFSFDAAMKRMSFEARSSNVSGGFAIIPVSELLEGPYYVTLNGQISSGYVTLDRQVSSGTQTILLSTTNQTLLLIPLQSESTNQISIIGTEVVPEFGTAAALLISATMISTCLLFLHKVK
jgi:hypothetical protein